MTTAILDQLEAVLGQRPTRIQPLAGGCIAAVYRLWLPDQTSLVAKVGDGHGDSLEAEGYMLRYLAAHSALPVPQVLHSADALLVMTFIEGSSLLDDRAQAHAAELLAALHDVRGAAYGLERDTLIGGLHQPNSPSAAWIPFFREQRLLYMGREALRARQLAPEIFARLERFCARLEAWLHEPPCPSLLHGDMWTTNILAQGGRVTGFIDPAIYYGHPEIELAFSTLFNTFGAAFFRRYHELRPIAAGFFEERRDIYNLYPLLAHVRLFGGGYVGAVARTLARFGC